MSHTSDTWLVDARPCPSPNQDARPIKTEINLLVIHNISLPPNQFGGPWIEKFFQNQLDKNKHPYFGTLQGLTVSAHLLIRRDGELVQFVPLNARAWHAGASCFEGRERCNDFSIGIELEGSDHQPFEAAQYTTLAKTCAHIMALYPAITPQRITGHSDIAPGRKTDPGPFFDWDRFHAALQEACKVSPVS